MGGRKSTGLAARLGATVLCKCTCIVSTYVYCVLIIICEQYFYIHMYIRMYVIPNLVPLKVVRHECLYIIQTPCTVETRYKEISYSEFLDIVN